MVVTKEELLPLLQDPDISAAIHANADTDTPGSVHHTLGTGPTQALQGTHQFGFDDFLQSGDTPSAPTGINVISNNITSPDGIIEVEAIISWTPVTTNTDGTTINADDLDSYLVSWRVATTGTWSPDFEVSPDAPVAYFFGLKPGQVIDVRVAARNLAQNVSDYGYAFAVTLAADSTPPNQPSKPIVTSLFGGIRVQWDGLDSVGATMALDFDHVDIHVGTTSTFIADDSNKVDSIPTLNGGATVLSYTDYGTNHYVKFRAVDMTGNHSTQSVASDPVAARQGTNADFQDVSATKITAGKLSVDVGLAGRLLIGPLDANGNLISPLGARIEIRNDGMHLFNGSNVEVGTFAVISGVPTISVSGPIISGGTITGAQLISSASGKRIVVDAAADNIKIYNSAGTQIGVVGADEFVTGFNVGRPDIGNYLYFANDGTLVLSPTGSGTGVKIAGGLLKRTLLHDIPYLDFPAINAATYGPVSVDGDQDTITTDASGVATIGHSIGRAPFFAIAQTGGQRICVCTNYTASSFDVTVINSSTGAAIASTSLVFRWVAIG